jgi:hypothetical protein
MDQNDNTIDLGRLMRISAKVKAEGIDALDEEDRAYLEHCRRITRKLRESFLKLASDSSFQLGQALYDALPEDLRERWAKLTPAQFALLALAFPDELPPEARRLLEPIEPSDE